MEIETNIQRNIQINNAGSSDKLTFNGISEINNNISKLENNANKFHII